MRLTWADSVGALRARAYSQALRVQTAAPVGDCKKAIEASGGDMQLAFEWLRKRGAAKASDLEGRAAAEGLVAVVATDHEAAVLQAWGKGEG